MTAVPTTLRSAPSEEAESICQLMSAEPFRLLDEGRGWAWGYAGSEGRVGYVPGDALIRP